MIPQAATAISDAALSIWAEKISRAGLRVPALFFLELHKPLHNLAYHGTLFAAPLLAPWFGSERLQTFAAFFHEQSNIERLCVKLENGTPKN